MRKGLLAFVMLSLIAPVSAFSVTYRITPTSPTETTPGIDLQERFPRLAALQRVLVWIHLGNNRGWAFATATSNRTQRVTTVTPE